MSPIRAALYARYSTDKQRDASVQDQFREWERAAKAAGLNVVARFFDKGISAGTAERPGYQGLLAAARSGEFDVIVTEDISRLWRNRAEFGSRSAELEDLGIHWLSCVGQDTRRDGWGLVIQILQAMAEHQRREQSYRTRRGQEGVVRSGKSAGGRAYGYVPAAVSGTGREEIEPTQAVIVRRIFEMYANGTSPRGIAATLNDEGIPSPGASWKRAARRADGKWLASAIHGDQRRQTGILNNRRYIGVVSWGRTEWKRSAADSSVRRVKVLEAARVEHIDERLRIVSDSLWQQVKARQNHRSHVAGAKVMGGLRKRRPGGGRVGKYPLSGLLKCGKCRASFALSNGVRYQCSSHHEGGDSACSVSLSVPRTRVESIIMGCVENRLLDPERLAQIEERYRAATSSVVIDYGPRIAELSREIANVTDAIAKVGLSDALAARLKAAESERKGLLAQRSKPMTTRPAMSAQAIEKRVEEIKRRLAEGGDVARAELHRMFPDAIWLQPDVSGTHLEAVFLDDEVTSISLLYDTTDELLDAQAAATLAAFARAEADRRVGNNGSGGRI